MQDDVNINPVFRDYLPSTDKETDDQLRELLRTEGQRDRIVVWKERNEVVDGHRRLRILDELGIIPSYIEKSFKDEQEVFDWMDQTQRSRRNMDLDDALINAVHCRERLGMSPHAAKKRVAEVFGVTERTVYRAFKRKVLILGMCDAERELVMSHNPSKRSLDAYVALEDSDRLEVLNAVNDETTFAAALSAVAVRVEKETEDNPTFKTDEDEDEDEDLPIETATDTVSKPVNTKSGKNKPEKKDLSVDDQIKANRKVIIDLIDRAIRAIDDYHAVKPDQSCRKKLVSLLQEVAKKIW